MTASLLVGQASAAMYGLPSNFRKQVDKVEFAEAVLPPFAFSRFCVHYADDCRVHGTVLRRPKAIALTPDRLHELRDVNRSVNNRIIPTPYLKANFYDSWSIAPRKGDCNDFAVTKRHELLARGWPSRALLLSEVIVPDGEHHMILLVRTASQDLVLDNLSSSIRPWSETPYNWVRVQSPYRPMVWTTIKSGEDNQSTGPVATLHPVVHPSSQNFWAAHDARVKAIREALRASRQQATRQSPNQA